MQTTESTRTDVRRAFRDAVLDELSYIADSLDLLRLHALLETVDVVLLDTIEEVREKEPAIYERLVSYLTRWTGILETTVADHDEHAKRYPDIDYPDGWDWRRSASRDREDLDVARRVLDDVTRRR